MKNVSIRIAGLAVAASLVASAGATSETLSVFAAASMKEALDEVAARYEEQNKTDVTVSYASSSTLARQIEFGAPADVFISANEAWMDRLEDAGKINANSRTNLLGNSLVLIGSASSAETIDITSPAALDHALGEGRLAVALVDAVPAGIYGKAALENLGLWDYVESRIAQTDNVRAALALVSVGAAPLGIVYVTDATADPRVSIKASFPDDSYPEIVYPAALVTSGQAASAQGFLDYLQSPEADGVFESYGFKRAAE